MISHKYKCIFLHIPKTAGTSIERYFRSLDDEITEKIPRQRGFTDILNEFGKDYYVFTFTRNPYERLKSAWRWGEMMYNKHQGKIAYFHKSENVDFRNYVKMVTDIDYRMSNIEKWSLYDQYHTLQQSAFIPDINNFYYFGDKIIENFKTDYIGKYESLKVGLRYVIDILRIKTEETNFCKLERAYKSKIDLAGDCEYDFELKEMVYEFYKEDFNLFNYDKDSIILQ